MKKIILTPLLLLFFVNAFAQDLTYELYAKKTNPIKKEKLAAAKVMGDIIPGYPTNWIMGYVSANMSGICNGKSVTAKGTNEKLNAQQINILNNADLGTNINITIEYKYKNAISGEIEISDMHYKTTYTPDVEAEYVSGQQTMTDYLQKNIITKIPEEIYKQLSNAIVNFTINEEGKIDNAKISRTSGDVKTDNLLLEAINNMPKWKPAENSNGTKVKQEFEFTLAGRMTGGC